MVSSDEVMREWEDELIEVACYPIDASDIVEAMRKRGDEHHVEIRGYSVHVSDVWMRREFRFPKRVRTLEDAIDPLHTAIVFTKPEQEEMQRCVTKRLRLNNPVGRGFIIAQVTGGKPAWSIQTMTMRELLGIRKKVRK